MILESLYDSASMAYAKKPGQLPTSQHCNRSSGVAGSTVPVTRIRDPFANSISIAPGAGSQPASVLPRPVPPQRWAPVADAAQLSLPSLQLARMAPGFPRHRRDTGARLQRGCNQPLLLCRAPARAALHRMIIQLQSCSCNYSYE
jgi:hypothetical protein